MITYLATHPNGHLILVSNISKNTTDDLIASFDDECKFSSCLSGSFDVRT
jgi:hypothetical protein